MFVLQLQFSSLTYPQTFPPSKKTFHQKLSNFLLHLTLQLTFILREVTKWQNVTNTGSSYTPKEIFTKQMQFWKLFSVGITFVYWGPILSNLLHLVTNLQTSHTCSIHWLNKTTWWLIEKSGALYKFLFYHFHWMLLSKEAS